MHDSLCVGDIFDVKEGIGDVDKGNVASLVCVNDCSNEEETRGRSWGGGIFGTDVVALWMTLDDIAPFNVVVAFFFEEKVF